MIVKVLQAKIQNAVITASSEEYKGSITIDEDILDELGVLPYQVCDVNLKGFDQWGKPFRGTTYILPGKRGSKCCEANGALSYHISTGDIVHINIYASMSYESAMFHVPNVIESNIE